MNNLRKLRLQAGLTQVQLAKKMKVTQASVTAWDTGKSFPTGDKLPKLAKILGCSIDDLYRKE